jgi:protein-S-isoprenylcysteine O-methyltransferase Ste14
MGARVFVWLGGTLFVASLAYCAYSFAVPWSHDMAATTSETDRWIAIAENFALLTVFALHHSLFAREPLKRAVARMVPAELVRSTYVWIASALLIAVCALWRPIGGTVYAHDDTWMTIVHALVQLTGIALIARAVATIDPLELAGIRPASAGGSLQVVGPYRLVRHPLYLGWVLTVFGPAHMTGDRLAFAAITTLYLVVAVPWEERSLRAAFGDDYARYMRRVRWRIVPFIY